MILTEAINADTAISLGMAVTMLLSAVGAIVASVTTRNKVTELSRDFKDFQQWRKEHLDRKAAEDKEHTAWRSATHTKLTLLEDRADRRASRPLPKADR